MAEGNQTPNKKSGKKKIELNNYHKTEPEEKACEMLHDLMAYCYRNRIPMYGVLALGPDATPVYARESVAPAYIDRELPPYNDIGQCVRVGMGYTTIRAGDELVFGDTDESLVDGSFLKELGISTSDGSEEGSNPFDALML